MSNSFEGWLNGWLQNRKAAPDLGTLTSVSRPTKINVMKSDCLNISAPLKSFEFSLKINTWQRITAHDNQLAQRETFVNLNYIEHRTLFLRFSEVHWATLSLLTLLLQLQKNATCL